MYATAGAGTGTPPWTALMVKRPPGPPSEKLMPVPGETTRALTSSASGLTSRYEAYLLAPMLDDDEPPLPEALMTSVLPGPLSTNVTPVPAARTRAVGSSALAEATRYEANLSAYTELEMVRVLPGPPSISAVPPDAVRSRWLGRSTNGSDEINAYDACWSA